MKSILAALRRQVSMNFLRAIRMTAVFLLLATPADSRSAEIGWEALNQEAVDLYRAGDYDRALEVAKRALEVAGKALGPDHPDVAANRNNLAALYYAQGDYAQAGPLFKRALAISEKALGPEHPNVATSLNNLATLYYAQGDYAQAEPLFKRALAIRERALGPDHPDVATRWGDSVATDSAWALPTGWQKPLIQHSQN
jgi:tetratricopeptide (TPR) repeat protein